MFWKKKNILLTKLTETLFLKGFQYSTIYEVTVSDDEIRVIMEIPRKKEMADLKEILPNLQQELRCHDSYVMKADGKTVTLRFGKRDMKKTDFNEGYIGEDLKLMLPSSFGMTFIDFSDGASCHLLNGGTTRMGKTSFLLYMSTMMYVQTRGNIEMCIVSAKIKDYYPFINVKGVTLTKEEDDLIERLERLILEYKFRDRILNEPEMMRATDAKSVKKFYPQRYYLFKPVFLIIDEYARYSENKRIQKLVTELVETAGYVNIHVVVASQRPDAKTVLTTRLKANLLCRICFTTVDKANSLLILDKEGAEDLGRIKGRAILSNGMMDVVQVPYLEPEKAYELLDEYREDEKLEEEQGRENSEVTEKIQSLFEDADREIDF